MTQSNQVTISDCIEFCKDLMSEYQNQKAAGLERLEKAEVRYNALMNGIFFAEILLIRNMVVKDQQLTKGVWQPTSSMNSLMLLYQDNTWIILAALKRVLPRGTQL